VIVPGEGLNNGGSGAGERMERGKGGKTAVPVGRRRGFGGGVQGQGGRFGEIAGKEGGEPINS